MFKYYIKYYINNPDYYSINTQKSYMIDCESENWINVTNINDISFINDKSYEVPYYLFIKYDSIEEEEEIINNFKSIIINDFSDMYLSKNMLPSKGNNIKVCDVSKIVP